MRIHEASVSILARLGVRVDDEGLREDLQNHGCGVTKDRVTIPSGLIDRVLATVKGEVSLRSHTGRSICVRQGGVWSHSTGGIPSVIDLETGQKRSATLKDFAGAIRLMNKLDCDMPCALLYPADVPAPISQVVQFEYLLRYSEKPVYGPGVSSPGEAKYIVELFNACASGDGFLGVVGISPESPLYYPKVITDTMRIIVSAGIPTVILVAPLAGISSPMTVAGSLAQLNANMLAFVTISHIINPKTPLIYGARMNFPNMKTGQSIWGLPEVGVAGAIAVQLASSYGFLSDVYGLSCTSCTFDAQAGYEKATNCLTAMLAGANLISGLGSLASLTVASYEQLVIDDEIFSAQKRVRRGVSVNEDTLALDVIEDVIKGGSFLEQEHTIRHLRGGEVFIPRLGFDRTWTEWDAAGQKDIREAAREFARKHLAGSDCQPIGEHLDREINRVMQAARRDLVKER
jgi:trimethylamine--corrinoid protein Co-methyltransferase